MRLPLIVVLTSGCVVGSGFDGPGSDAEGPFLAVATHTMAKSGAVGDFGDAVKRIDDQLAESDGFVGVAYRGRLLGRERWTLTVWEDEDSLYAFSSSGAHLEAMEDTPNLIDGVYTASWWLDELPPSWDDAEAALAEVEPETPFP